MSTKTTDLDALRLALHLAIGEFMGPELLEKDDEDSLAIRFIYEGLSAADAIDLAVVYAYSRGGHENWGVEHLRVPPLRVGFQQWIDDPPEKVITALEQAAINGLRAWGAEYKHFEALREQAKALRDAEAGRVKPIDE